VFLFSLYLTVTLMSWCVGYNPPKVALSPQFPLTSIQPPSTLVRKLNITYFSHKRASILYLTSSSLETRIVGYSNEPAALLTVFGWPFLHLIPYLVLVAFSQIFSVDPPHIGHLKSFIYFHPKTKKLLRKSQE